MAFIILGVITLGFSASAATVASFSPSNISVAAGQSFNVLVTVNPQGVSDYAEKLEIKYPADILQVNSFTMNSQWLPLSQAGYDLMDNVNGVLIKSAGYPGGFSSATNYGTISFYAKKAGSGIIMVGNNSTSFEVNSQTSLTGNSAVFAVTAPAVVIPVVSTPTVEVSSTSTIVPETESNEVSQSAAVATASTTPGIFGNIWLWALVIVVIILVLFGIFASANRNRLQ